VPSDQPKGLSLVDRLRLLKRVYTLRREVDQLYEEVRTAEGAVCPTCGGFRVWRDIVDESTQEEQKPLICKKCINRRKVAHESGWHEWPNRL
jgi:hypothetical protein